MPENNLGPIKFPIAICNKTPIFTLPTTKETDMTKLQQIYRELRKYMTAEEARYAAPKLIEAWTTRN
jgi:hypothetical protein